MSKELQEYNSFGSLVEDIRNIMAEARADAAKSLNISIIHSRWLIGRRIVKEEQNGELRAQYGTNLLNRLSKELTFHLGKGYDIRNLALYRQLYADYKDFENLNARVRNLTWTHVKILLRVDNPTARDWYFNEAATQMWSTRTLDRNVGSQYYHRLLSSGNKDVVEQEMKELTSGKEFRPMSPEQFIKSPVVTEFLGLPQDKSFTEETLESALLTHLEQFILELGKGYSFVARQQRIVTDTRDYYIDLVFYNYLMRCFVLIDLKTTTITHQDVGQMDMYIRMYDELKRGEYDNPTVGILLCAETSKDIARYSILNGNKQLFASKYLTYLPSEEELLQEIDRQKELYLIQKGGSTDDQQ